MREPKTGLITDSLRTMPRPPPTHYAMPSPDSLRTMPRPPPTHNATPSPDSLLTTPRVTLNVAY